MDRNFSLELVRVTEAGAIAASQWIGRGDEKAADQAAVDAMRKALNTIAFDGTVVIGEGERDEAPMLYIGEHVGQGGPYPKVDIALDPLEGTTICARGDVNALSVLALTNEGGFLHAPDTYMYKLAVGPQGKGIIDIRESATHNLKELARANKKEVSQLSVIILDRPRHADLIQEVRAVGARVILIRDGDVSAAITTCNPKAGVDLLIGSGGAPEGVLAAAALQCLGGEIQGILQPRNEQEIERAKKMGIRDIKAVLKMNDLAQGRILFSATGVTDGGWLRGVKRVGGEIFTHSIVMRYESGTIREIKATHQMSKKSKYIYV